MLVMLEVLDIPRLDTSWLVLGLVIPISDNFKTPQP